MATPALLPEQGEQTDTTQMGMPADAETTRGQDATTDDPNQKSSEENKAAAGLTDEEKGAMLELRRKIKQRWALERRAKIRRVRRAFEMLQNRPFTALSDDGFNYYDPFESALNGGDDDSDLDLYQANDNVYQMLENSFVAALSKSQSQTRFQPENADEELDVATARRGSDVMAYIERRNKIRKLQKRELTHLFTSGCYFSYTRYLVDASRAGTTKSPVVDLVPTETAPDRYLCKRCAANIPATALNPFIKKTCPQCGYALGEDDFYPAESMLLPQTVGFKETPNGMVAIDVYGALNVDTAFYADSLETVPLLDLEMEVDIASLRSSYSDPDTWKKLGQSGGSASTTESDNDRAARQAATSPAVSGNSTSKDRMLTYSRCWIQNWTFNDIDNEKIANSLKAKFPMGCKLVTAGTDIFLEAREEKLTDSWTWCPATEGRGIYPPGVGDVGLDIQDRINDVSSLTFESIDRTAGVTIVVDGDAISSKAMDGKIMANSIIEVKRKAALMNKPLSDLIWQPKFEPNQFAYTYTKDLLVLVQMLVGIRPEIFGGSDPNVQTAQGQQQQLNQAIGRLLLYLDQMHEEHAERAEKAVKCQQRNMDDDLRHVVEGDTDSGFANEYILLSEMQGSFHSYAESDQGFPASFSEMKQQVIEMLKDAKDNPLVMEVMQDADNQQLVMNYAAPPGVKLADADARAKYKRVLAQLATEEPQQAPGPDDAPMFLPSVMPDKDVDDMQLIKELGLKWTMKNYKLQQLKPAAYQNVKAYIRMAGQFFKEKQAADAVENQMLAAANAPMPAGPPAGAGP